MNWSILYTCSVIARSYLFHQYDYRGLLFSRLLSGISFYGFFTAESGHYRDTAKESPFDPKRTHSLIPISPSALPSDQLPLE